MDRNFNDEVDSRTWTWKITDLQQCKVAPSYLSLFVYRSLSLSHVSLGILHVDTNMYARSHWCDHVADYCARAARGRQWFAYRFHAPGVWPSPRPVSMSLSTIVSFLSWLSPQQLACWSIPIAPITSKPWTFRNDTTPLLRYVTTLDDLEPNWVCSRAPGKSELTPNCLCLEWRQIPEDGHIYCTLLIRIAFCHVSENLPLHFLFYLTMNIYFCFLC